MDSACDTDDIWYPSLLLLGSQKTARRQWLGRAEEGARKAGPETGAFSLLRSSTSGVTNVRLTAPLPASADRT
jgi:hypothetical protein